MWMGFISFSCLTVLSRIFSTILNRNGKSGILCPIPDLRGKDFNFSPLSTMLAVELLCMAFITLRNVPSVPSWLCVFIMKGCSMLPNVFSVSVEVIICFLSLILLMWYIDWFVYVELSWDKCYLIMMNDSFNVLLQWRHTPVIHLTKWSDLVFLMVWQMSIMCPDSMK